MFDPFGPSNSSCQFDLLSLSSWSSISDLHACPAQPTYLTHRFSQPIVSILDLKCHLKYLVEVEWSIPPVKLMNWWNRMTCSFEWSFLHKLSFQTLNCNDKKMNYSHYIPRYPNKILTESGSHLLLYFLCISILFFFLYPIIQNIASEKFQLKFIMNSVVIC